MWSFFLKKCPSHWRIWNKKLPFTSKGSLNFHIEAFPKKFPFTSKGSHNFLPFTRKAGCNSRVLKVSNVRLVVKLGLKMKSWAPIVVVLAFFFSWGLYMVAIFGLEMLNLVSKTKCSFVFFLLLGQFFDVAGSGRAIPHKKPCN